MDSVPKTFFITGGAGFLGINMTRFLLKRGHRVISFDLLPFDYPERSQITEIEGDIRDAKRLTESMKGADMVIHTAAALPLYKAEDIRSTDIQGTKNVCEAARMNHVERLIHISSTAVYGIPDHHPLYESDKLDGVGEYGKAKIAAETICLGYRGAGMTIPIIRPKSFIGPERLGVFALFYEWAKDGRGFPMIGYGHNRYQLLDVEDLCEAIYLSATLPKETVNDTFNIGAKEFTTMKEDYQAVLDVAGFGKKIHGFPAAPMIFTLRILEALKLSPLYKWVYETASKDSFVSIEKAEKKLGFKPKYSNKDALIRNYRWYLLSAQSFQGKSGVSHRVPWKQGILKVAKIFF
ncbi:MAG: NAD(P)-dependent oxidoreductase [bacterium]|nr:NAD(P)-dependent oxidoreductase [bacterium]